VGDGCARYDVAADGALILQPAFRRSATDASPAANLWIGAGHRRGHPGDGGRLYGVTTWIAECDERGGPASAPCACMIT
jgi:hypothetical protein